MPLSTGSCPLFSADSLGVPGYATVYPRGSYSRRAKPGRLTLRPGIDNLADKFYWVS